MENKPTKSSTNDFKFSQLNSIKSGQLRSKSSRQNNLSLGFTHNRKKTSNDSIRYYEELPDYLYEFLSTKQPKKHYKVNSKIDCQLIPRKVTDRVMITSNAIDFCNQNNWRRNEKNIIPILTIHDFRGDIENRVNCSRINKKNKSQSVSNQIFKQKNEENKSLIEQEIQFKKLSRIHTLKNRRRNPPSNNPLTTLNEKIKTLQKLIKDPLIYDLY